MEPFIAQIMMFGGNFAPRGWAFCHGQLLAISSHTALFSILGTMYGGDGRTTFGLPDMRGRSPIGVGHGPGLSNYREGQKGGVQTITLTAANLPSHSHTIGTTNNIGNTATPGIPATSAAEDDVYHTGAATAAGMSTFNTGGSQAFDNRNPFIAINYIIALQGVFPSRS